MDKASCRAVTIRRLLSRITAVSLCLCGALCSVHPVAYPFLPRSTNHTNFKVRVLIVTVSGSLESL
ncbi:hypothetical protein F4811DRAFT_531595 [Daldinia bambusicola]|nr:hypothetical protein F4811DRAFT_531595 [Daldinia bambusicola]